MENRSISWSVTTSALVGERIAGLVLWFTALLVIGVVAIQVPKILGVGILFLIIFVLKVIKFLRLRRVQTKLKAVKMVADEFLLPAQPFTLQFELDASENFSVERVLLICEWRSRAWNLQVKRFPMVVTPVASSVDVNAVRVTGLAPALTKWANKGFLFWLVRVQVQGVDFSFPLQIQKPRFDSRSKSIGVPK